jgi:hypothetical protein
MPETNKKVGFQNDQNKLPRKQPSWRPYWKPFVDFLPNYRNNMASAIWVSLDHLFMESKSLEAM